MTLTDWLNFNISILKIDAANFRIFIKAPNGCTHLMLEANILFSDAEKLFGNCRINTIYQPESCGCLAFELLYVESHLKEEV